MIFIKFFFLSKHDLVVILNKNKPRQLPTGKLQACFKKTNCNSSGNSQEHTNISRSQAGSTEISGKKKGGGKDGKCPHANDTHFQPDFRGSWVSGLVALVLPGKNRIKNSSKRVPDLEEEVGGKGQGAAGVRHARTGGWRGSLHPDAEMVLAPPCRARRRRGATGRERGRSAKALPHGAQSALPTRQAQTPSYRVSWHP